ncbi:MAG: type II toxin-antitoxin system RelE/ParE family toxin [Thermoflexales bacterium]|nr:type II toxin-antitoxin system RelE/ParE family toxin [Thermoflexales bacterium]
MAPIEVFWTEAARQLASFPESGRHPPELPDIAHVREIIVQQFRIIYDYQPDQSRVAVLAVFHSRRDVPELIRTRLAPRTA